MSESSNSRWRIWTISVFWRCFLTPWDWKIRWNLKYCSKNSHRLKILKNIRCKLLKWCQSPFDSHSAETFGILTDIHGKSSRQTNHTGPYWDRLSHSPNLFLILHSNINSSFYSPINVLFRESMLKFDFQTNRLARSGGIFMKERCNYSQCSMWVCHYRRRLAREWLRQFEPSDSYHIRRWRSRPAHSVGHHQWWGTPPSSFDPLFFSYIWHMDSRSNNSSSNR